MLSFTAPIDDILVTLNKAVKATKPNKLTPITEYVLLSIDSSEETTLILTASDVENTLTAKVPLLNGKAGALAMHGNTLTLLLRKLSESKSYSQVKLSDSGNGHAVITTGKSNTFKRPTLPESQYLSISDVQHTETLNIHTEDLRTMLDLVLHTVATTSTAALRGVYIYCDQGDLVLAGTNGYKLCETRIATSSPFTQDAIIDKRSLDIVYSALCAPPSDSVSLNITSNYVSFMSEELKLISMPIQAQYPQYTQFLTRQRPKQVTIQREELIKKLNILTTSLEDTRLSIWEIEDNMLKIYSQSQKAGSSVEMIDVEYEDDPLKIGFNIQIVLDTLKTLEEEELIFHFNDDTTPVLIESTVQNITTKNIIVPMRT